MLGVIKTESSKAEAWGAQTNTRRSNLGESQEKKKKRRKKKNTKINGEDGPGQRNVKNNAGCWTATGPRVRPKTKR